MEYKDYYATLGVKRDASQDEIKRAYRSLARKYHPDLSKEPNAEDRFKEIGESYEVLGDTEKRAAYDQLGSDLKPGQEFRPPPGWDAGFEYHGGYPGNEGAAFSDFFETLFGGARQGPTWRGRKFRAKGEDHHARVLIDIEDAYHGATRSISLHMPVLGDDGHIQMRERTLKVKFPKGVGRGQHIRLKGQGGPSIGDAPAGDLFLEIDFKPHRIFRVEGRDIYLDLPVAPWEAALGGKVTAPTPGDPINLTVPAGSAQGRKLRIKGRGIPGKKPGDLYCVLRIVLPPADSEEAQKVYDQMKEKLFFNPRSTLGV
jgi:curved DNA-binding protein